MGNFWTKWNLKSFNDLGYLREYITVPKKWLLCTTITYCRKFIKKISYDLSCDVKRRICYQILRNASNFSEKYSQSYWRLYWTQHFFFSVRDNNLVCNVFHYEYNIQDFFTIFFFSSTVIFCLLRSHGKTSWPDVIPIYVRSKI